MAASDNHIFLPAGDLQVPLLVQAREVAGHEPAMAVEGELRRALIVEIAEHQGRPAHTELTNVARLQFAVMDLLGQRCGSHSRGRTFRSFRRLASGRRPGSVYWCEQVSVMP